MARLSDAAIKRWRPKPGKVERKWDGQGLYLEATAAGTKVWRLKYRRKDATGKLREQRATLGRYGDGKDEISLKLARDRAREAREDVARGGSPTVTKRTTKLARATAIETTFRAIAGKWLKEAARSKEWSPDYCDEATRSLELHVYPTMGSLPIGDLTPAMIAMALDPVERRAPDQGRKVRQRLRAIFNFALTKGIVAGNPVVPGIGRKNDVRHFPAITDTVGLGEVLLAAELADVGPGVARAHLLLAFTCQRVGEVVPGRWSEVDFKNAVWRIPRTRMKRKDQKRPDHVVPVPPPLLAFLEQWRATDGDTAEWICPSPLHKSHVTREAVEKFYNKTLKLAGKHSPHSWRTAFSTLAHDAGHPHDIIEAQLDHLLHNGNKVAVSYDRGDRLKGRELLSRWWADTLVSARAGAQVASIPKGRSTGK